MELVSERCIVSLHDRVVEVKYWDIHNYGKYINQFPPNTIKAIRQCERSNKKIYLIFNEICINEETHKTTTVRPPASYH